jgi:hypothetical protein
MSNEEYTYFKDIIIHLVVSEKAKIVFLIALELMPLTYGKHSTIFRFWVLGKH